MQKSVSGGRTQGTTPKVGASRADALYRLVKGQDLNMPVLPK